MLDGGTVPCTYDSQALGHAYVGLLGARGIAKYKIYGGESLEATYQTFTTIVIRLCDNPLLDSLKSKEVFGGALYSVWY